MSNKYPCVYYDNGKCQKFSDDHYTSWCDFDQCEHRTPSNADYIRAMSDEELTKAFWGRDLCNVIEYYDFEWCRNRDTCKNCGAEWLKQPHKEDT